MKFKTILACIVKILNSLNVLKQEHKNKSEKLFEQYLDLNGFKGKWTYEPSIPEKNKKLDYRLDYNNQQYYFEVKELRKKDNEPTKWPASINPYTSLRKAIHGVRKQFKEFRDYSCSLVVFNIDDRQARLRPNYVFAAMLGNEGFEMDIDNEGKPVIETAKNVFLDGGKMIDDKTGCTRNTTISAIVVLEEFLDNVEIEKAFREEERRQGREFTAAEAWQNRRALQKKYSVNSVPRVVVIENPFARIAFPDGLFVGQFDERWRYTFARVFVGNKLKELEELKNKE